MEDAVSEHGMTFHSVIIIANVIPRQSELFHYRQGHPVLDTGSAYLYGGTFERYRVGARHDVSFMILEN